MLRLRLIIAPQDDLLPFAFLRLYFRRVPAAACQKQGIFNGDEANRFNPQQKITRAETAKVMVDSLKIK